MKKAIIIGHSGQGGTYLSALLTKNNYDIIGISLGAFSSLPEYKRTIDIRNYKEVEQLIIDYLPDEVYYLAAVHQSSADKPMPEGELFNKSIEINLQGLINFLEGIKQHSKKTRVFYAASSHIFGNATEDKQNERTPLNPNCIYGITKTAGVNACHFYRNNFGVFASIGIFYNHESPLRESKYVSKKIVEAAVAIKLGKGSELILGNLEAKIDWGYAPDYMEAIHKILNLDEAEDFIVSSGELHTVGEFVNEVFSLLGLDPKKFVKVNSQLITKTQKKNLFGDNQKLRTKTNWAPSVNFKELISILVEEELKKRRG